MFKQLSLAILGSALLLAATIPITVHAAARDLDVRVMSDYAGALRDYPVKQGRRTYRAYIEAKRGDGYALEITNNTDTRIGVVVAVDGRNIISGKHSKLRANERMYILRPYQRAVYRGWRSGKNRINRFYFSDADDSYSAAWGDYSAMGVIAVAAFAERNQQHYRDDGGSRYKNGKKNFDKHAPSLRSKPGTGYGDEEHSASRRVHFEPKRRPFAQHFLKYEWRKTLCRRGVIDCAQERHRQTRGNRFWDEDDFAQRPPRGYRHSINLD